MEGPVSCGKNRAIIGLTAGKATINGGDVTLTSANPMNVNQPSNTTIGSGGTLTILNGGVNLNNTVSVGAGNVTLNGNGQDIFVNANESFGFNVTFAAQRDVVI